VTAVGRRGTRGPTLKSPASSESVREARAGMGAGDRERKRRRAEKHGETGFNVGNATGREPFSTGLR